MIVLLIAGHSAGLGVGLATEDGVPVDDEIVPLVRIAPQTFCAVTPGCDESE